jgi:hypothetical protein
MVSGAIRSGRSLRGLPVASISPRPSARCLSVPTRASRGAASRTIFEEAAASLDLETQDVERIYGALEGMGWIDRAFLVTWDERQPDNEDPTAAARMARMRSRTVIVDFWSMGRETTRLFFRNPLEFQQMRKERVPSQRNLLQ